MKRFSLALLCAAHFSFFTFHFTLAQSFTHFTTTEGHEWQQSKVSLSGKAAAEPVLTITGLEQGHEFRAWGTCFNELDLDALELLKPEEQEEVMRRLFAPDGDLKFTRGRLTMNANDYSRAWYSCDTVAGDFQLKYFNIEHDKANVIRLIRKAQQYQPQMTFWVSPWSPPAWMKINQDYPVCSSQWNTQAKEKDYLLFDDGGVPDPTEMQFVEGQRGRLFPRKLASQTYFIQDPRYLQAYANMFCKFIDLYREENIPIDMVMYQNEAYSYTPYPGCAWTAEGTLRFNRDYLIPAIREKHPEVEVNIGTLNTNRLDYVSQFIDGLVDKLTSEQVNSSTIKAIGLQWEGRYIIDSLRQRYPGLRFISTESECGNGSMDWRAGEHTFYLLSDYIGRGCDEYYIWNFILCDQGRSPWGWKQNALVQVKTFHNWTNSQLDTQDTHKQLSNGKLSNCQMRFTPEFYAVKHFSHLVTPGSRMQGYVPREQTKGMPVIVFQRPDKRYVVIAGNQTDEQRTATIKLGKKYLNMILPAHSMHTFAAK
ncbi:MAG: glycoside hydrolase family 30 protein [Bacteroidaceae bacterium]|nr:glycoside hydrolase family 30 protein [Bacteroidaceae bacterium]